MAKTRKELTCTFFVGDKRVDKLTEEQSEIIAQRLSVAMSRYYTRHIDEFIRLSAGKDEARKGG